MIDGLPIGGLLDKGVAFALILIAAWGYHRGWWLSGREGREIRQDRDFWRDIAMKGVSTAEKMADQKGAGVASLESIVKTVDPTPGGGDP